jgi:hypothetical protein
MLAELYLPWSHSIGITFYLLFLRSPSIRDPLCGRNTFKSMFVDNTLSN